MRLRAVRAALSTTLLITLLAGATLVVTATDASAAGPSMSITFSAPTASYGEHVTVRGTLGSATQNRTLKIYAQGPGGDSRLVREGTVNSSGRLTVVVTVFENLRFSAVFDGDATYDARTVSRSLPVHGRLVMAGSSTSRSGIYHLYQAGTRPIVKMRVDAPNPGRCVAAVAQQYYSGAWHTFGSQSCLRLSSTSHTAVQLKGTYRAGNRVRVVGWFRGGTVNASSPRVGYYILFTR